MKKMWEEKREREREKEREIPAFVWFVDLKFNWIIFFCTVLFWKLFIIKPLENFSQDFIIISQDE